METWRIVVRLRGSAFTADNNRMFRIDIHACGGACLSSSRWCGRLAVCHLVVLFSFLFLCRARGNRSRTPTGTYVRWTITAALEKPTNRKDRASASCATDTQFLYLYCRGWDSKVGWELETRGVAVSRGRNDSRVISSEFGTGPC